MVAPQPVLSEALAGRYSAMALANVGREYPTKLDHFINGPEDLALPSSLHPVFWGSFDWHSCVHSHWMLARLLRLFPDAPFAADIRAHFDARITSDNVAGEVAYLAQPNRASFVRTYGWAWLLKLAAELEIGAREPGAGLAAAAAAAFRRWQRALQPLTDAFVGLYLRYLPKANVPLRYGLHPNSAFGVAFAIDYAGVTGDEALAALCRGTARGWFAGDADYPARFEPSGNEFLSPSLIEADLMRRVLDAQAFAAWLGRFLPGLASGEPRAILVPVVSSDHSDPQVVHLDGLNLSRAWCLGGIAQSLPESDPRRPALAASRAAHLDAGLRHVQSGDYMGEHWLASFAVHALTQ